MFCQEFLVAETVLQSEHHRSLVEKWRKKIDKVRVGSRFHRDDYQIARADLFCGIVTINFRDPKIFTFTTNKNSVAPDVAKVAAHQKVHIASTVREFCAVVRPNRSRTDDADPDSHLS